jgi:hypothetical protein
MTDPSGLIDGLKDNTRLRLIHSNKSTRFNNFFWVALSTNYVSIKLY